MLSLDDRSFKYVIQKNNDLCPNVLPYVQDLTILNESKFLAYYINFTVTKICKGI